MTSTLINTTRLHNIANVDVDVKYRQPGNVVAYISIAFNIYKDGTTFVAMPLAGNLDKRLTNLPNKFSFKLRNGIIYVAETGLTDVVADIVNKLRALVLIEAPQDEHSEKKKVYLAELLHF